MRLKIGIDVGGTFTDFLVTGDGALPRVHKVPTTPTDPSIGLIAGLEELAAGMGMTIGELARSVETIVHGTTVTTNAVLTGTGAKTALLTTHGVRDALEMRRGIREEQFNNRYTNVAPLVPRYRRMPVRGRLNYLGEELTALNLDDVRSAVRRFREERVEAVAICFMNSFANAAHEKEAARIVREELPDAFLTVSSDFLPSIRFYDRLSSTVLNSYVGPKLSSYLDRLVLRLREIRFGGVLLIMQSNGGVCLPEVARENPARTLLSGPAAGPEAGLRLVRAHGHASCITIDMGGTSFDAALVQEGVPSVVTEGEINRYRIALPMLDIVTIGAGGGSIGWIDDGGLLRMGPQSAGADPGPVCYGGAVAGGYNPHATEVWQEALRIPPVKVYEKGTLRKDVWDLIFANIRFDIVQQDMRAQIGSCMVGERRMIHLLERYGRECFERHKEALFASTRRMMESEIAGIPTGTYRGESTVYYDGRNPDKRYTIRIKVIVEDRRITFDYSDTDSQSGAFVNGTFTSSASAAVLTFLQMVNSDIPHNQGMVEPIRIIIPEGTILNAAFPAATTYGNHLCPANADAIVRALAPVVPERVSAGWNHLLCALTTGVDPRRNDKYVDICFMGLKGGSGAVRGVDGYDHIGMIDASGGLLDQNYEMFEQQTRHLLVQHEYLCDSAGPGQWRGGLGVQTQFDIGSDGTQVVIFGDGDVEPAFGLFGGGNGSMNAIKLRYPTGTEYAVRCLDLLTGVPKGTRYQQWAGGGGGYGNPHLRPAERVAEEVRNGVISREAAHDTYGVALKDGSFEVDPAETSRLRTGGRPGGS